MATCSSFSMINLKLSRKPEFHRGYNHEKNITRHMRIQTRRQILFASEFCGMEEGREGGWGKEKKQI